MIRNYFSNNIHNTHNHCPNRQNLAFDGRRYVSRSFLGEKYFVPKKVVNAGKNIQITFLENSKMDIWCANSVKLKNNIFLGIAHLLEEFIEKQSIVSLGKKNNKEKYLLEIVPEFIQNRSLDLALFMTKSKPEKIKQLKSGAIKLAKKQPEFGETVYLAAYNMSYKGLKIIPASYYGNNFGHLFLNFKSGYCAKPFEMYSKVIRNKIEAATMSGSPVLNKKGELIGILKAAGSKADMKTNGNLYFVGIEDIKKFLKEEKILSV